MEIIFIKYLLIPILVVLAAIGFGIYAKINSLLRPGRLMLFILILAVFLVLPSLLGFMTYNFIPFGLVFVQVAFFTIGILMVRFFKTGLFQSIGLGDNQFVNFLVLLVALVLGAWGFFLIFEILSGLSYSLWVATTSIWFLFPVFYLWATEAFFKIPPAYYEVWDPMNANPFDESVWENADYLRMMNISLKIKKSSSDKGYSSYPVRAPAKIPVAQWFVRYIKDHRVKFPNSPIEIETDGEPYCWIFYTTRFFIFNRPISPGKTFEDYRIRNKSELYVRRVQKVSETY